MCVVARAHPHRSRKSASSPVAFVTHPAPRQNRYSCMADRIRCRKWKHHLFCIPVGGLKKEEWEKTCTHKRNASIHNLTSFYRSMTLVDHARSTTSLVLVVEGVIIPTELELRRVSVFRSGRGGPRSAMAADQPWATRFRSMTSIRNSATGWKVVFCFFSRDLCNTCLVNRAGSGGSLLRSSAKICAFWRATDSARLCVCSPASFS